MELNCALCATVVLFLLLPLLCRLSNTFNYCAKITVYYTLVMATAFFIIPVFCFRPMHSMNISMYSRWGRSVFWVLGIRMTVRGEEHLQNDQPCIIVVNHQSSLDLIGLTKVWPDHCTVLGKKQLKYAGPFGIGAWLAGVVFVDRLNHEKALDTMNTIVQTIKSKKIKLWVFPEGRRNRDGTVAQFKKGAFHLAVQAQVPIVPIVFSSYSDFYNKKEMKFNSVLPPIPTEGTTSEGVNDLTEKVRLLMQETFTKTSLENAQSSKGVKQK